MRLFNIFDFAKDRKESEADAFLNLLFFSELFWGDEDEEEDEQNLIDNCLTI